MNHYKIVTVPERKVKELIHTTCDICNQVIEKERSSREEVTIAYSTGQSYPECGYGTITEIDMCPSCFTTKLKPWLESQGCDIKTEEWSW